MSHPVESSTAAARLTTAEAPRGRIVERATVRGDIPQYYSYPAASASEPRTIMSTRDDHYRRLERMYLAAPCNAYFRPEIRVGEGTAEVRLTVRPDFFHAASAVHGSVYFKLLDDATFFAASSLVDDVFVLTASFNIYLLRPISAGVMMASGTIVSRSKRLLIGEGLIVDEEGKDLARGTGTFMPGRARLDEQPGYR